MYSLIKTHKKRQHYYLLTLSQFQSELHSLQQNYSGLYKYLDTFGHQSQIQFLFIIAYIKTQIEWFYILLYNANTF